VFRARKNIRGTCPKRPGPPGDSKDTSWDMTGSRKENQTGGISRGPLQNWGGEREGPARSTAESWKNPSGHWALKLEVRAALVHQKQSESVNKNTRMANCHLEAPKSQGKEVRARTGYEKELVGKKAAKDDHCRKPVGEKAPRSAATHRSEPEERISKGKPECKHAGDRGNQSAFAKHRNGN